MSVEVTETGLNLIPAGYKQTEVGVIPKDWEISQLRDLLKTPPKYGINAPAVPLEGKLPVYIRITDISEDGYFKPSEKVGVKSQFSSQYQLANGDIVLARTGASVGKSYLYKEHDGTLIYAGFLIKVSPDKNILEPRFLSQYLQTQRYWSWVNVNSMRSGQPGINGNEYGSLLVPLPKIDEQNAIATALSDVDALISELEKLIAKKQAIKTATMQQLLTGRTRLPPFAFKESALREDGTPKGTKLSELGEIPEDWEVHSLSSICDVRDGTHDSPKYKDNGIPLVTSKNIVDDILDLSNVSLISPEDAFEIDKRSKVDKGDIIMSMIGTVGSAVLLLEEPKFCIKNVALFKPKKVSGEFLVQLIRSKIFQDYLEDSMDGGIQKFVSLGTLRNMEISLPPKEEQAAIATILSDMDAEIQALNQRLSKTRQIKQGMMQELLTGKTRLIKPSKEVIHE
ncbi:restriction endonuclease subunit S [Providencia rettgeri]|uniref:restriction endonuclease subunit S n=1 Tax=Providencia rettgeri TaxID=587 RepID=UPI001B35C67B|nr:restriction endonuclease subunit S [Providencia rettgeri]MBQ0327731.1 restriction endonuclease subunit S [Providencia rettgeri]